MKDIETLKAIYEEKQAKYQTLCEAADAAHSAYEAIKELCNVAMDEMHEAGMEYLTEASGK